MLAGGLFPIDNWTGRSGPAASWPLVCAWSNGRDDRDVAASGPIEPPVSVMANRRRHSASAGRLQFVCRVDVKHHRQTMRACQIRAFGNWED